MEGPSVEAPPGKRQVLLLPLHNNPLSNFTCGLHPIGQKHEAQLQIPAQPLFQTQIPCTVLGEMAE